MKKPILSFLLLFVVCFVILSFAAQRLYSNKPDEQYQQQSIQLTQDVQAFSIFQDSDGHVGIHQFTKGEKVVFWQKQGGNIVLGHNIAYVDIAASDLRDALDNPAEKVSYEDKTTILRALCKDTQSDVQLRAGYIPPNSQESALHCDYVDVHGHYEGRIIITEEHPSVPLEATNYDEIATLNRKTRSKRIVRKLIVVSVISLILAIPFPAYLLKTKKQGLGNM